jgi:hypothetical protein
VGWWQVVSILLACSGAVLPLVVVLLVPAKACVDDERIRRLTIWLAVATIPAVVIAGAARYWWPNASPFAFWVYFPLWFGLGMPAIMAKRPESGLSACPKCNYPIPEKQQKEEVRCPECGMVSRPNRLLPVRVLSGGRS